jgi:hypothetical protein
MSLQTDIASLRFRINQLEGGTTTGGGGGVTETYFYVSGSETITSSNSIYISGNAGIILTSSTTNNLLIISSSLAEVISGTINRAAPNLITPVNVILATGSSATISIAILPKSSGSFLLSIPDNTAVGGNIRGSGSIDLQRVRDQAFQVAAANSSSILGGIKNEITSGAHFSVLASGEENIIKGPYGVLLGGQKNAITFSADGGNSGWSALVGGLENSSSGRYSFIGGGQNNKMGSNDWQVVAGGRSNNCAGQASFIGSGEFNTITASTYLYTIGNFIGAGRNNTINGTQDNPVYYSSILGGTRNVIEASNCVIPGGTQVNSLKTQGRFAFGSGHFGGTSFSSYDYGNGSAQMSILVTRAETTGTTPNYLTTDGSTLRQGTLATPIYYWNSNYVPGFQAVKAHLIAASSDGEYAYYEISYVAKSTGVLGTPTVTTLFSSAGASTWSIGVFHPGVYSPATAFSVTGSSGKNIRWVATSYTTHLSF